MEGKRKINDKRKECERKRKMLQRIRSERFREKYRIREERGKERMTGRKDERHKRKLPKVCN